MMVITGQEQQSASRWSSDAGGGGGEGGARILASDTAAESGALQVQLIGLIKGMAISDWLVCGKREEWCCFRLA